MAKGKTKTPTKASKRPLRKDKAAKSAKDKPAPAAAKPRKRNREEGMGHNLTEIRKLGEEYFTRMFTLQEDMDSDMAGYRSDFKDLYQECANATGAKKSVVIKEFKRALRNKREQEKEALMDSQEREQAETFRAAMEGTPMGDWFAGQLAPAPAAPPAGEPANDEEVEGAEEAAE